MMDMVVTQRVNAGMEEAFEALAKEKPLGPTRRPAHWPFSAAKPLSNP